MQKALIASCHGVMVNINTSNFTSNINTSKKDAKLDPVEFEFQSEFVFQFHLEKAF